jgi:tight adherence protein C
MTGNTSAFFTIGLALWAFVTLVLYLFATRKKDSLTVDATSELFEEGPRPSPKRVYSAAEEKRNALADRLIHAGLYSRNSSTFYYTSQLILASVPMFAGAGLVALGFVGWKGAALGAIVTAGLSWITPSLWLDQRIKSRQQDIRRALPDALDVLVISLEAGMSLPAALVRISKEMSGTYPLLATELTIVQREVQMGNNMGTALKSFADRFGLEELRSLASVVIQAERYGASVVQALRIHAETLRLKRLQAAQEKAQTATVKLLIPTVLFIFPAIFVVILGPAAFRLMDQLSKGALK